MLLDLRGFRLGRWRRWVGWRGGWVVWLEVAFGCTALCWWVLCLGSIDARVFEVVLEVAEFEVGMVVGFGGHMGLAQMCNAGRPDTRVVCRLELAAEESKLDMDLRMAALVAARSG